MELNIQKWYKKISYQDKKTFAVVFFTVLLSHFFRLVHFMPTSDSIKYFYDQQDAVDMGRWSLTYAAGISSWYDIQWLEGVLAIFYLVLTAIIVVKMLDIKNSFLACMSGVILGVYPSTVSTFSYMYAADAYFLAMLLAAIAAYLFTTEKWVKRLLGSVLLAVSIGIYQAYGIFTIVLLIVWLLKKVLFEEKCNQRTIFNIIYSGIIGAGIYIVAWLCRLQGQPLSDNQGINEATLAHPLTWYVSEFLSSYKNLLRLMIKEDNYGNVFVSGLVVLLWLSVLAVIGIKCVHLLKRKNWGGGAQHNRFAWGDTVCGILSVRTV